MSKTIRRDVLRRKVQKGLMEARTKDGSWVPAIFIDDLDNFVTGIMNLTESDFKSNVGTAWENPDGSITLYVHSNFNVILQEINPEYSS